ncbi:hypothetical protein CR513_19680, partial [Mucuna pruriens]
THEDKPLDEGVLWTTNLVDTFDVEAFGRSLWTLTAFGQWKIRFRECTSWVICLWTKTLLCMTRSSSSNLHVFDPEIDRTLYRLRKFRSNVVGNNSSLNHSIFESQSVNSTFASNPTNSSDFNSNYSRSGTSSDSNFAVNISQFSLDKMDNNDRTLKELATLDVMYQPWCIQYPQLEQAQSYELKSGLIHVVCSTVRLYQDESIPVLPGWFRQGLVIFTTGTIQYLGGHEEYILEEVHFGIHNINHLERDLCHKATLA